MNRLRVGLLVALAAVTLTACGSVSLAQATTSWEKASALQSNLRTLASESRTAVHALEAKMSADTLHTICEVLFTDATAANSSLPSPDSQATKLLHRGYDALGRGAVACYTAYGEAATTTSAVRSITAGVGDLALARLRLAAVTAS